MNKVYKVIWSKARNCYMVVSELAKRNGKNTSTTTTDKRRKLTAGIAMAAMALTLNLGTAGTVEAAPGFEGGQGAKAFGENSVAVGTNAKAGRAQTEAQATAYDELKHIIKNNSELTSVDAVQNAMDYNSLINALRGVGTPTANNYLSQLTTRFSVLMGHSAIAVGYNARAFAQEAIAVGRATKAYGTSTIAVGVNATAANQTTQDQAQTNAFNDLNQTIKNDPVIGNAIDVQNATTYTNLRNALNTLSTSPDENVKKTAQKYLNQLSERVNVHMGFSAIAVGNNAQATKGYAIAVGNSTRATGEYAIAVGNSAQATKEHAIAVGYNARAFAQEAIAVGRNARSEAEKSIAIGSGARATHNSAIAIGTSAGISRYGIPMDADTASDTNSIAIGRSASNFTYGYLGADEYYGNAQNSIAIGYKAHTHAANAFAIGVSTDATAERSFAIGTSSTNIENPHQGTRSVGQGSIVFGDTAHVMTDDHVKPVDPDDDGPNRSTDTRANDAMAMGTNSQAGARNAVALGGGMSYTYHSIEDVKDTPNKRMTNITKYFDGSKWEDRAVGTGAKVGDDADGAVAIGGAAATVKIKKDNKGNSIDNVYFPTMSPTDSLEIEDYTSAAKATVAKSVSLGTGSVADRGPATNSGYDVATGTSYAGSDANSHVWKSTVASVSVGGGTINGKTVTRQITNVAAGLEDTDAVNVAQLKKAKVEVESGTHIAVTKNTAAEGHSVYTIDAYDTNVVAGDGLVVEGGELDSENVRTYKIGLSEANQTKIDSALSGFSTTADGVLAQVLNKDKAKANFKSGKNIALTPGADGITIATKDDVEFKTVNVTNVLTVGEESEGSDPITISMNNVNMGGNRIQNVGAGTEDSDAVNYGQLKMVASRISSVGSDNRAVTIDKEEQIIRSPYLHINGVDSDIEEKDKAMASGMESIAIGRGATAEKHLAVAIGTGAEAAIHSSVALGDHSVTTAEDKAGIRTGKYGYDVVTNSQYKGVDRFSPTWQSTAGSVSVGGGVEPATKETVTRRISNVAAGIKDTDVVNVAQLKRATNYLTDHRNTSIGTNANGERVIVSPYLAMHGVEEAAQAKSLTDTYPELKDYTGALQKDINTLKVEQTNLNRDVTNLTNQISGLDARLAAFNDKTTDAYKELAYERSILNEEKTTLSKELNEVTELLAEREDLLKTADADYEKAWELASNHAQADGEKSFAHGSGTRVKGKESMAQGSDSTVVGNQSIAIGTGQEVYGSNSGAIGDPNVLAAERSYVIGNLNTVGDKNDIKADSDTTKFDTNNVFVFGNDNTVESGKEHVYILGSNVTKTEKNSVILGNESAVYAEANNRTAGTGAYKSETINGKTYNYAGGDNEVGVVSVGNADAPRRIQNVAPGKVSAESTDAINGSQLYSAIENVNTNLGDQISNVDSRANKGIAGAAALAALHPLDFDPDDKLQFSAGMGHYRGKTAAAVGLFYRPDEKVMFNIGGTMGNGENLINAGVTFSLDRTPRVTGSRTALTKEVVHLREQVAKQDQQLAMQGAQIAQLTALVSQLTGKKVELPAMPLQVTTPATPALFPDNLDNKWAYDKLEELEQQGYIRGYAGRTLSRDEFAAALDRALAGGATLEERLVKEFEPELSHVRVAHVEGKGNEEGEWYERPRTSYDKLEKHEIARKPFRVQKKEK